MARVGRVPPRDQDGGASRCTVMGIRPQRVRRPGHPDSFEQTSVCGEDSAHSGRSQWSLCRMRTPC